MTSQRILRNNSVLISYNKAYPGISKAMKYLIESLPIVSAD